MRELHGVVFRDRVACQPAMKRHLVLFDKLRVVSFFEGDICGSSDDAFARDVDFLYSKGILLDAPIPAPDSVEFDPSEIPLSPSIRSIVAGDILVRHIVNVSADDDCDVVGIYHLHHPRALNDKKASLQTVLNVGLGALPVPDETCALNDILDFKAELRERKMGFRRFLKSMATKQRTEGEVRDEIEWLVNEYRNAMELHHLKASQSFVDVFLIAPLEIIESIVKFNWSKIAKGALQVQKRKVELMEAEMKAPGRECAYVFDARKRFGKRGYSNVRTPGF